MSQGSDIQMERQIRDYVNENLLFGDGWLHYDDDTSFLESGIVDSMGVMELVSFVGSAFAIQVDPLDITLENFDSVGRLAAYIRRKQGTGELHT